MFALLRRPRVARGQRRPVSFVRVVWFALAGAASLLIIPQAAQSARPLEGRVRDAQTLLPVPGALVEWVASGQVVQADEEGHFRFESVPDGHYGLCVRRIGYVDRCDLRVTIGPEELLSPVVYITARALEGTPVEVGASALSSMPSRVVMDRDEIIRSGATTAADVLTHAPEVEVLRQSDGSARVSIRGGAPEGVKVLVDDVPLSASGQAADLSTIPAHEIERIEVVRGPAVTVAGADALAGAVLITTRRSAAGSRVYGRGGVASFGGREGVMGAQGLSVGNQQFGGSLSTSRSDGDFKYHDDQFATDTTRNNNESFRRSWSLSGSGDLARHLEWSAGLQQFDLDAGVPGLESELTPQASRAQERASGSARLQFATASWMAFVSYALADDWNHFLNTGSLPYNTEQRAHWYVWRSGAEWHAGGLLNFAVSMEQMQEDLWGEDHLRPPYSFGTANRRSSAATIGWSPKLEFVTGPLREASVQLAYRYDYTHTEAQYPHTPISPVIDPPQPVWEIGSPNVSGGVAGKLSNLDWSAHASWGRAFRRPPILEQFWVESYQSQGNPGLKPERSEQWELGYALNWPTGTHLKFEQRYYWGDYSDLIFWRPRSAGGAWLPDNIGRARIDGREESLEWDAVPDRLTFRVDHLFADHENTAGEPNTNGDPLPFRYRHKVSVGTRADAPWGWIDVSYRSFDRRYLREDAIKSLDPYDVVDVVAGARHQFWGITAEAVARVLNFGSEEYEVIERDPMPGRNYTLSLNLSSSLR